ncbi:MAG: adenylyl-sulfate kinase [Eubacteriales bacterium]
MLANNITPHRSGVPAELRRKITGSVPAVFWMSGLSGSGKSTIAVQFEKRMTEEGHAAFMIDGDTVRTGLCMGLGFSAEDRHENLRRIAHLARTMASAGLTVVVCTISPDRQSRDTARKIIEEAADFYEVYIKAPVEVCAERDPKGLYRRAYAGEIANFTGVSAPYEIPEAPDLTLDTTACTAEECAEVLVNAALEGIYRPGALVRSMLEAAMLASAKIMEIYNGTYDVSFKEDSSPLTTADTASNEILTTYFRKSYPEYSILTEEEASAADVHGIPERLSNNAGVFIIDPLDGTKEFLHRNGEFCVSIGFATRHRIFAGVIAVPAKRLLYYAAEGHGSYKVTFDTIPENVFDSAGRIHVSNRTGTTGEASDKLIVTASRSHGDRLTEELLTLNADRIGEVVTAGSCLKGCLIAEGAADVHYRFGSFMKEWDTSAMQILCEEAGGLYTDAEGNRVPANRADPLNHGGFVILNSPKSALKLPETTKKNQ